MLIRVLEIPASSGNFHFTGGEPQWFIEVDWFREIRGMMESEDGRIQIADFIKRKPYFSKSKAYLVLHPSHTFTIGYEAP